MSYVIKDRVVGGLKMSDAENNPMLHGSVTVANTACPDCGSTEFEMRNYEQLWREGDIHCARCGKFIRRFDAG